MLLGPRSMRATRRVSGSSSGVAEPRMPATYPVIDCGPRAGRVRSLPTLDIHSRARPAGPRAHAVHGATWVWY